jgi:hypothetical protein
LFEKDKAVTGEPVKEISMKKSSLSLISTLALIVLVILLAVVYLFTSRPADYIEEVRFFPENVADTVKIDVAKADGSRMVLVKNDGEWFMEEPVSDRADTAKIERVMGIARNLIRGEVVTDKKQKLETFVVDDNHGVRVKFEAEDNNLISDFYLGRKSDEGSYTFMRYAGDDKAYMCSGNFGFFWRHPNYWRVKRLVELEPEQIASIELEYLKEDEAGKSFSLNFDDDAEKVFIESPSGSQEADPAKAAELRQFIASMECTGFKDEDVDYKDARIELNLKLKEGDPVQIKILSLPEEKAWVAKVGDDNKNFGFHLNALKTIWQPADSYLSSPPPGSEKQKEGISGSLKELKERGIIKDYKIVPKQKE